MSHATVNNNVTHERINQISEQIKTHSDPFRRLLGEVGRVIVGQEQLMHRMLVGLLGNGHLLIEGVPGLAKTTAVSCLAKGINTGFQRLQFTPDLLPADLIGTLIYRPQDQDFVVQKGPIFSNLIFNIFWTFRRVGSLKLDFLTKSTLKSGEKYLEVRICANFEKYHDTFR